MTGRSLLGDSAADGIDARSPRPAAPGASARSRRSTATSGWPTTRSPAGSATPAPPSTSGLPPDWRADGLDDDEEWHIEWSKFYFGLDLAHAYAVTGDPAYLDAWEQLVEQLDRPGASRRRPHRRHRPPAAELALRLAGVRPGARHSRGSTPGLEDRLLGSIDDPARPRRRGPHAGAQPPDARAVRPAGRLARAARARPGRRLARHAPGRQLQDNLLTDVWTDGVHRERSTHYHLIALRSFLGARVNVTRFGGRGARGVRRPAARRPAVRHARAPTRRPDPRAVRQRLRQLPRPARARRRRPRRRPSCAASRPRDARGIPPGRAVRGLPGRRLPRAAQRLGRPRRAVRATSGSWSSAAARSATAATATTTPCPSRPTPTGTRSWSTRAATPTPRASPNWRHWFKGTAAHNTVTVDGLDQQPYRRGKPKGRPAEQPPARPAVASTASSCCTGEVTQPGVRRGAPAGPCCSSPASTGWSSTRCAPTDPHDYALRWHLADDRQRRSRAGLTGAAPGSRPPTLLLDVAGARARDHGAGLGVDRVRREDARAGRRRPRRNVRRRATC